MKKKASLNHQYRLIWRDAQQGYVAVAEHVNSKGKASTNVVVGSIAGALSLFGSSTFADPSGGEVVSGDGQISQSGKITRIHQTSQNITVNWQSFNVERGETVHFEQPNSAALAINKIADTNGSSIMGNLNANGQVWLINPNGILFGKGAQVNVGALLATTLNPLSSQGEVKQVFGLGGVGSIMNYGNIKADSGYVAFIANAVSNQGNIIANHGTVAMGAGSKVSVTFSGNQLLSLHVDQSTLDNLAENKQLIQANGGTVLMSAGAKDSLLASVVNNEGKIEAKTVQHAEGKIVLLGGMASGTTKVSGTLDASADAGNGGFIETSAAYVNVGDEAKVTTQSKLGNIGHWLIDPVDFTVAASGGDMTGAAVNAALASNNFQIQSTDGASGTSGDININDAITWHTNNTLKLTALNNININREITATGAAGKLALEYGQANPVSGNDAKININAKVNLQAGDNFSTRLGDAGATTEYKVITALGAEGSTTTSDLQGMLGNLSGKYVLGADIDASATSAWHAGAGFAPIGDSDLNAFKGYFNGLNHQIMNLTINRPAETHVGLFGFNRGEISKVGIVGGSVTGNYHVGGLVGGNLNGDISHAYTTNNVTGDFFVGGLIGYNQHGELAHVYATGAVTGSDKVGGMIGYQLSGDINQAYALGNVVGNHDVGGLVGTNFSNITNAYASGNVNGISNVGGLVGNQQNANISDAYATGAVTGSQDNVGGLTGYSQNVTYTNTYATGGVLGVNAIGGLIGAHHQGEITNAHATGHVNGTSNVGGLLGSAQSSVVSHVHSTGNVKATANNAGGLVGAANASVNINNAYAHGATEGVNDVGGLVGLNHGDSINNSYASGHVKGTQNVGGLVGSNKAATLNNAYASGNVEGNDYVGGFVGINNVDGKVSHVYAAGEVAGNSHVGGLVGVNEGVVESSFWNAEKYTLDNGVGTGKVLAQLQSLSTYKNAGWDVSNEGGDHALWRIYEGYTSPLLRSFMTKLDLAQTNAQTTTTYNGETHTFKLSDQADANLVFGDFASGKNAGTYTNSLYSTQHGYDIVGANASLTIAKRVLNLTGHHVDDGTLTIAASKMKLNGLVDGETLHLSGTGTVANRFVGDNKTVFGHFSLLDGTGLASNYSLDGGTKTVNITPNGRQQKLDIELYAPVSKVMLPAPKLSRVIDIKSGRIANAVKTQYQSTQYESGLNARGNILTLSVKNGGVNFDGQRKRQRNAQ